MQATAIHQQSTPQATPQTLRGPDAPQGDVLLLLYDGAIRFVNLAKDQIKANNRSAKEVSLAKAYAIINEFINSLDRNRAPDLCENLTQIYEFMLVKLTEANANMDPAPLDIVLGYLTDMRGTWAEAIDQSTS
jgi:flagellar secretion chaperone FliS